MRRFLFPIPRGIMLTPTGNPTHDSIPDTATAIQLAVLNERLLPLIELTKQHEITLRGEKGTGGLIADVNDLKRGMDTIRRLSWLAIGSGIGTLVMWFATYIKLQVH
jgi:hypothetical protein